mmetsp:Transcript_21616/g.66063  ORF Transcript_21616/g.66063 Transcript_21616/m.66063 type:complete len:276 (+) Transcript_21616:2569-3396(+)
MGVAAVLLVLQRLGGPVGHIQLFHLGVLVQQRVVEGVHEALEVGRVEHLCAQFRDVFVEDDKEGGQQVVQEDPEPRVHVGVLSREHHAVPYDDHDPDAGPLEDAHVDDFTEVVSEAKAEVVAVVEVFRQLVLVAFRVRVVGPCQLAPAHELVAQACELQHLERLVAQPQRDEPLRGVRWQLQRLAQEIAPLLYLLRDLRHLVHGAPLLHGAPREPVEVQRVREEGHHDEGQRVVHDLEHVEQHQPLVLAVAPYHHAYQLQQADVGEKERHHAQEA